MKVLGIDPGTARVGYGMIDFGREFRLISYGVIEIDRKKTGAFLELAKRVDLLLAASKPDLSGLETIFFSKNQKTALSVSEARGVIRYLIESRGIPLKELRPIEVKQAVTGYGFANKESVAKMVKKILGIQTLSGYDDASDALAIAIASAMKSRSLWLGIS